MSATLASRIAVAGVLSAAMLAMIGDWSAPRSFLAGYLAAWWFWLGIALGSVANVWMHTLTGGTWGEPLRAPLLSAGQRVVLCALLFVPVLVGVHTLYPWASPVEVARWPGEIAHPDFKRAWFSPLGFALRSIAYLLSWSALAALSAMPRWRRSKGFAAFALLLYGFSVSLAAVDWIMSLVPLWYSTIFGLIAGIGQMLAAFAFAIVLAARTQPASTAQGFRDLGNLLLMYVLSWAYLAFTQYLIIWAENLPHEIAWYVPRLHTGWRAVGIVLVLFHFVLPFAVLLFRRAKQRLPLALLAAGLLGVHLVDVWWLILPSLPGTGLTEVAWSLIAWIGIGAAFYLWHPLRRNDTSIAEGSHA
jgi:hypothetical protein